MTKSRLSRAFSYIGLGAGVIAAIREAAALDDQRVERRGVPRER